MGRPLRKGLHYFNIDCDQDDTLNFIEARHGIIGYGVVVKLWRKIYMLNGYFCEWAEKNIYLFAREVNVDVETVNNIVETCFTEELFNRKRFEQFRILTSRGIQRRYIKIVTEAKRKDTEIDPNYLLLEIPVAPEIHQKEEAFQEEFIPEKEDFLETVEFLPEKEGFLPEETPKIREVSTQTKVKETKEKETKEKKVVAASPAPKKFSLFRKEEEPEPYWPKLVEAWMDFGKEKFGAHPGFERDDPRIFKRIIQRLKKRALERNIGWTEAAAVSRLRLFLESAFSDKWVAANFLLSNLEKQFDKFIQRQGLNTSGSPPPLTLQQLCGRFREGNGDPRLVLPKHFEELQDRGLVTLDERIIKIRMESLVGSNIFSDTELYKDYVSGRKTKLVEADREVLMRLTVLEYLKNYAVSHVHKQHPDRLHTAGV